jgi:hypothetical protein
MKFVKYAVSYRTLEVPDTEFDLVHALYNLAVPKTIEGDVPGPAKIIGIKFMRAQHGLGLREAKDVCDEIGAMERPFFKGNAC